MNDLLIGIAFLGILISPAIIAAFSGKSSEVTE